MTTQRHVFKKGDKTDLDSIYEIQGLANGDWWTAIDPESAEGRIRGSDLDEVTITRNISITIIIK